MEGGCVLSGAGVLLKTLVDSDCLDLLPGCGDSGRKITFSQSVMEKSRLQAESFSFGIMANKGLWQLCLILTRVGSMGGEQRGFVAVEWV